MKLRFTLLPLSLLCAVTNLFSQTVNTPPWLTWLGAGINPFTCTSGTCNLTDELWFTSFSVSLGATVLNAGGNGPLVIRSTGACTIAGTIDGSGGYVNTGNTGITGNGDFGGAGGGGGGGTGAGTIGLTTVFVSGIPIANGGAAGTSGGGAGGSGLASATNQQHGFIAVGSPWPGGGARGGFGYGYSNGGGQAGAGGTPIIFICDSIDFTGTIKANGSNGQNAAANNTGGGGGGGGGYVLLAAKTFTANSGTINTSGGTGGSCGSYTNCGAGGNGGAGWSYSITIQ
ncbi:MAG TPA: hypothetical protein VHU83_20180 [Bryobacteraceae bacterium]|jgi:hypothetical protein|nr:hypothetical protein [Bryobacteraceae bacterium]